MNRIFKFFLATFLSAIIASSAFGKDRKIYLMLEKGKLIVREGEVTDGVRRQDKIWWIKGENIDSFQVVPKSGENNIFTSILQTTPVTTLSGEVAYLRRIFGGYWEYSITAWGNGGTPYPIDPKIPVRPIISLADFAMALVAVVASIFALLYRRRWLTATNAAKQHPL